MNKSSLSLVLSLSCALALGAAAAGDWVEAALARAVLPANAGATSFTTVFNEVEAADAAADAAWRALKGRAAYDARRAAIRARYEAAVGGFPARTDLKARVVARLDRPGVEEAGERQAGYRVEKILFESRPGEYLTALLYLPDAARFRPPYAAFLVSCGHAGTGKGSLDYGRACVLAARQGLAALIYDPIGQGERTQDPPTNNCEGHNRYGALAALLGTSTARQRIWDGMRCCDYLDTRDDIRHDGYGIMGNSGGGTMTALIAAMEPRIKAATPACYLTSMRTLAAQAGPQDAEQNVFGQLAFGLNHAGYVLTGGNAVRLHACHNDFFPFAGTRETYRVVAETAAACGLGTDRYGLTDVPGPHGWKESTRTSSIQWMRRWLLGEADALPIDVAACRARDVGFDIYAVDHGLGTPGHHVAPGGDIRRLPGFKSVYATLREDLAAAEAARPARTPAQLAARVRARAGFGSVADVRLQAKEAWRAVTNGTLVAAYAFSRADGLRLPAQVFAPRAAARGAVLLLGDGARAARADRVRAELARGRLVLVADLIGTGEIGHQRHSFYGAKNPDEEIAVMLYWLGRSLVGERAGQIVALADFLKAKTGFSAELVAEGRTAVAAAHAFAAERALFAGIEVSGAPSGWAEAVRTASVYRFANVVHGGLLDYDWIDLLKAR